MNQIVEVENDLTEFAVTSLTRGIDALGEVTVRVKAGTGEVFTGRGTDGDISRLGDEGLLRSTVFCRIVVNSSSIFPTSSCAPPSGVYHEFAVRMACPVPHGACGALLALRRGVVCPGARRPGESGASP